MTRDVEIAWAETAAEARMMADRGKTPMEPIERLGALYRSLEDGERQIANRILSEEVLSLDDGVRYDALALIRQFAIVELLPALRRLLARLEASADVPARFEANKVRRLMSALSGDS